mmetsp:Transcript_40090/g.94221  ORF Transcript_40090/g.94221 Transcript_40090/m.94221 type:complete len:298 (-) Transcript_40090:494-1387(-)
MHLIWSRVHLIWSRMHLIWSREPPEDDDRLGPRLPVPNGLPVGRQVRHHHRAVEPSFVPVHAVGVLDRHAEQHVCILFRNAPRSTDRHDVAPRVQRVAVAPEPRVLHRRVGHDSIKGREQPFPQEFSCGARRHDLDQRVQTLDVSILERSDLRCPGLQHARFKPRALGANHKHMPPWDCRHHPQPSKHLLRFPEAVSSFQHPCSTQPCPLSDLLSPPLLHPEVPPALWPCPEVAIDDRNSTLVQKVVFHLAGDHRTCRLQVRPLAVHIFGRPQRSAGDFLPNSFKVLTWMPLDGGVA